jgi:hypothetical protein
MLQRPLSRTARLPDLPPSKRKGDKEDFLALLPRNHLPGLRDQEDGNFYSGEL